MARSADNTVRAPFAPPPIADVVAKIHEVRPDFVFAPHVETSSGLILPHDYIKAMASAAHEVGAFVVLDCVASGCVWVDMVETGVDILISAPQKGWSASPSMGLVMMSARAHERLQETTSDSYALDLKKWQSIMAAYEAGGHAYHGTLPTDALVGLRDAMVETKSHGLEAMAAAQWALGDGVRAMLREKGVVSVAADGYGAPGVVVSYTDDPDIQNGKKFAAEGMQIAAGVPLQVGEGDTFRTFRLGLFGFDKLTDVDGTMARLKSVVDRVL
jgi:aspartate aminotransferase-like enzyme